MKKLFTKLAVIILLSVSGKSFCQTEHNYWDFEEWGEVYFSFETNNEKDLDALSRIISIDKYDNGTVIAYANERTFQLFLDYGYTPTILPHPSILQEVEMFTLEQLHAKETYEWDSYPTYPAYVEMMDQFQVDYPTLCTTMRMGMTVQNRELIICKVTSAENPTTKTRVLLQSSMHGDETTGYVLMLRMIDYLCSNYGTDPRITNMLDNAEIWICPLANPDGTYHGGNNTVNGSQRSNGAYVDLNRNYKDDVYGDHPDGEAWQPETIAFMNLTDSVQFTVGFNIHGGAEVCNYAWDNKSPRHADNAWWVYVCREFADTVHVYNSSYMTYLNNGITNGYDWYTITGSRQDNANAFHNLKEFTLEISDVKTLPGGQLRNHWDWNYRSFLNFIEQGLYGIHGTVTDSETGQPVNCEIVIEGHDTNGSQAVADQYGYYARPIKAGTYDVTYTALGYEPVTIPITIADKETIIQNVQLTYTGMTVDFQANVTDVPLGATVNFTNNTYSQDPITSYYWEFTGGTPSTSTEENPSVVYSEEGIFDVTLTVTSESETSTITKENYINVTEMYNMQNGAFTTCSGMFYDDGGANNNYGNNKSLIMTFVPGSTGAQIVVAFSQFSTENNYDKLYVYNGPNTSSPSLGTFTGNNSPGTLTSTAADGSMTFKFTSDGSVNYAGWTAEISCIGGISCEAPEITGEITIEDNAHNAFISWNNVETASVYNIYRNGEILTSTEETVYVDNIIENGISYCYTVTAVCGDNESDMSNEVCLSYLNGDANGNGTIDVTDIISIVNYIMESNPEPFVHYNADVNLDNVIDVIDIVAIIQSIYSDGFNKDNCNNSDDSVIYTIENNILYIETSTEISGMQFTLESQNENTYSTKSVISNFQNTGRMIDNNSYVFVSYSEPQHNLPAGKHAIMSVGDATVTNAVFANTLGCKIDAINGNTVGINEIAALQKPYPSPFNQSVNISYTINGKVNNAEIIITNVNAQIVGKYNVSTSVGDNVFTWTPSNINNGVYFVTLRVDNIEQQHFRIVYQH